MPSRRVVVGLVALLIGLTGCSPPDRPAIQVDDRGLPQVVNCGGSIDGVEVSDAETGRVVWAASAGERDGSDTSATVSLGDLPEPSWVEDARPALDPRPSTWRFDVSARGDSVIVVPDDELRPGRVYRPGGTDESTSHYDDRTCTGIPVSLTVLRLGFVGLGAGAIAGALISHAQRVRRNRPYAGGASGVGGRGAGGP